MAIDSGAAARTTRALLLYCIIQTIPATVGGPATARTCGCTTHCGTRMSPGWRCSGPESLEAVGRDMRQACNSAACFSVREVVLLQVVVGVVDDFLALVCDTRRCGVDLLPVHETKAASCLCERARQARAQRRESKITLVVQHVSVSKPLRNT